MTIKFITTAGQVPDCTQAVSLLKGESATYVIADKGHDSNEIVELIQSSGAIPVIPARNCRSDSRNYDKHIDKELNIIERLFNRLKNFRKIATRYEKNNRIFEALIYLASVVVWVS